MTAIFRPADERGMALPMAVFALVVIGALVAGIFFTGRIEQRTGTNAALAAQAFETAEAGVALQMASWGHNGLGVGDTVELDRDSLGPHAAYSGTVQRLSDNTFLLQVQGEQYTGSAQTADNLIATRLVGRLLKLSPVQMTVQAALLARGNVAVRGTATLSGQNTVPPTWDPNTCDPAANVTGIRTSGEIDTRGTPAIDGDPPYEENYAGLSDSTFMRPFNELKASYDIRIAGGSLSPEPEVYASAPGICNTDLTDNWGEPYYSGSGVEEPCQSYFPVILSQGNLRLNNGRGQGVLLVEGDLVLAGNFEFNGIIIVTGTFDASHGTNMVHGAVLSSNARLDDMTLAGTPTVNYSACAVARALNGAAPVTPLAGRSWVQMY
jgi:hypothetical protein